MSGTLRYESNNSGGDWWLSDQNWRDLEAAGWAVKWRDGRWLGALATSATIATDNPEVAIAGWEQITGQSSRDIGCDCCGEPHNFTFVDADGNTRYSSLIPGPATREWWS